MDMSEVKKKYSWAGISYFVFLVGILVFQIAASLVIKKVQPDILDNGWVIYLLSMIPMWALSFPICALMMKKLPTEKVGSESMKFSRLVKIYVILTFIMMLGNIIGNMIAVVIGALTGHTLNNSTIEMISEQELLPNLIFAVILGPIMEELAFRKLLIDKLGHYSKKYTIILSGVMFGLIHMNLFQFFYATAIGIVFAYIYTLTGKIRYTIGLHMTVNTIHGLIPVAILRGLDLDRLLEISGGDMSDPNTITELMRFALTPNFLLYMLYVFVIFCLFVAGIILFILNIKKIDRSVFDTAIPKELHIKTVYLNVGMILFIVGTIAVSIFQMLS